jgi:hypothetical protein
LPFTDEAAAAVRVEADDAPPPAGAVTPTLAASVYWGAEVAHPVFGAGRVTGLRGRNLSVSFPSEPARDGGSGGRGLRTLVFDVQANPLTLVR